MVFKLAAGCASMVLLAACSPWLLGESVSPYTFVGILLVSIGVFQYFQPAVSFVSSVLPQRHGVGCFVLQSRRQPWPKLL